MRSYTSYALRTAVPADVERIAEVWYCGWLDAHVGRVPDALVVHRNPDDFPALVTSRVPLTTVAVDGDRVIGFVTVKGDEVEEIYVAAEARGGGAAVALLQHAEDAIAARFASAWLAVVAGNERARRFYERNGWSDGGAFDYAAEAGDGTVAVPCRRYEKMLKDERASTAPRGTL